jgi:Sulfotransferase domain
MRKIAIHSVPRSGSSWLGQIFNSSPDVIFKFQPLFSYAFKDYLNEKSTSQEIDKFFIEISNRNDEFLDQTYQIEKGNNPVFAKNEKPNSIAYKEVRYHHILHNMLKVDPDVKVVGLIRNPFSVINSWLKSPREFRSDLAWDIFEEWRFANKKNSNKKEEFNGFDKWKEVCLLFHELSTVYPERFYLLKYDNLLQKTGEVVDELFAFLDIPMNSQTLEFINSSKSINKNDPYSVFKVKNKDSEWKNELNKEIAKQILAETENHPIFKNFI